MNKDRLIEVFTKEVDLLKFSIDDMTEKVLKVISMLQTVVHKELAISPNELASSPNEPPVPNLTKEFTCTAFGRCLV